MTTAPFTVIDPTQPGFDPSAITTPILGSTPNITIDPLSLSVVNGPSSVMQYDGSLTALGIGAGLLITSGTMPPTSNTLTYFGTDNGMPGDPDLDAVVNTVFSTVSYDATTISFSFNVTDPTVTGISFNAVFGTDEYPEWVDQFVDIAVVMVNGVNYAYFGNNPQAPLSVVTPNLNAGYFIDNSAGQLPIEYDGVSGLLNINAPVHQGLNTIKIGIADTGDHIYDSGLFISNLTATTLPNPGVTLEVPCTSGDDNLTGTVSNELFNAGDGNDTIAAGAGDDAVVGGAGDDNLNGDDGNDYLDGGSGTNALKGGAGDDTIVSSGMDQIDGGAGKDLLKLDLSGASTGETFSLKSSGVAQTLSSGTTIVNVEAIDFHGGSGVDKVTGGSGQDSIDGGAGNDVLAGGNGNDVLTGGAGNDQLNGGGGIDTAVFSGASTDYQFTLLGTGVYQVADQGSGAPDGIDTLSQIEKVQFSDGTFDITAFGTGGPTLTGTAGKDVFSPDLAEATILTSGGDDTIYALGGDDDIDGGGGNDVMYGGTGDDTYIVDQAGDLPIEAFNEGVDVVEASVSFALGANIERLILTGKQPIDGTGNELNNVLTGNGEANTLMGLDGNDTLNGGGGDDTLLGGGGNDVLNGGAGVNTASYADAAAGVSVNLSIITQQNTGGAGLDTLSGIQNLTGSAFNDNLAGNAGDNAIDGGAGTDTASYADAGGGVTVSLILHGPQDTVGAGFDTLTSIENLTGSAFDDNLLGNGLANRLIGGDGNDALNGRGGADLMIGGAGDDTYSVDNAGDVVSEDAGGGMDKIITKVDFTLASGQEIEMLRAGPTPVGLILGGNEFDNRIIGDGGNNTISGGGGRDILSGGAGNDTFVLSHLADTGATTATADRITDFQSGDHIDLTGIEAELGIGLQFIEGGPFSHHAGDIRQFAAGANTVLAGDLNGDNHADFEIVLTGSQMLHASDFIL